MSIIGNKGKNSHAQNFNKSQKNINHLRYLFTNLYDSSIESNFTPHMFISCLKESAVMNHKKCDFQKVIG